MSLLLSTVMATTPVALGGCDLIENINNNQNNPDISTTVDPNKPDTPTKTEKDYSGLSQIMLNVLNDEYYNDLIRNDRYMDAETGKLYSYSGRAYGAFPFAFLEDEGYDIEKIKDGSLYCKSEFYLKGNDMYMELKVENESSTQNYLTNYILKYHVTDQEIKEINMLYVGLNQFDRVTYYQAPFYIQELTYDRDPEIISEAYITREALEQQAKNIGNKDYSGTGDDTLATYMGEVMDENQISSNTFQVHLNTDKSGRYISPKNTVKVGIIRTRGLGSACTTIDGIKVYFSTKENISIPDAYAQAYLDSLETVTHYNVTNTEYKDVHESTMFDKEVE